MTKKRTGAQIRQHILRYLLDREHVTGSNIPEITEIIDDLGFSYEEISDQLDILEAQGAIKANRTFGGGAAPLLTGKGKAILEELEGERETPTSSKSEKEQTGNNLPAEEIFDWDAFISHATEDKESFVRELAQKLVREGIRVWYDESTLQVGDSLRRSIERGLSNSRYGIVVLSHSFFSKEWPQTELDGLVTRERNGEKVILPVWLDVDKQDVIQYSIILADRLAAKAKDGMGKVIEQLLLVLNPSPFGQQNALTTHEPEVDIEIENTVTKELISPKLLSTTIKFQEESAWENLKGEMFAVLINWIDYENIEDKLMELKFPEGIFRYLEQALTLYPGKLPLNEILSNFGKQYRTIEFGVDKQFDFGDLVRRSRGGIRTIEFLSNKTMTLKLQLGKCMVNLTLKNNEERCNMTITVDSTYYSFTPYRKPISYDTVLDYLEKDPPTEELKSHLDDVIR